jgi:hypothetical protein
MAAARELRKEIYRAARGLPDFEKFGFGEPASACCHFRDR